MLAQRGAHNAVRVRQAPVPDPFRSGTGQIAFLHETALSGPVRPP